MRGEWRSTPGACSDRLEPDASPPFAISRTTPGFPEDWAGDGRTAVCARGTWRLNNEQTRMLWELHTVARSSRRWSESPPPRRIKGCSWKVNGRIICPQVKRFFELSIVCAILLPCDSGLSAQYHCLASRLLVTCCAELLPYGCCLSLDYARLLPETQDLIFAVPYCCLFIIVSGRLLCDSGLIPCFAILP